MIDLFGSGSTMAPNSEEGGRIGALRWEDDTLCKEKQRPPLYNPEDYASSFRKWTRRAPNGATNLYTSPSMAELDCPRSQGSSFRDYRNPMLSHADSEMTLRQFGTVSELLSKLKADLRLSYPSFVQEFVSDPHDGVTLLLELLRTVQMSQGGNITASGSSTTGRIPPSVQRRAVLDELTCLQCLLCCCIRYTESVRRLAASSAGLFTLAVCIMNNANKARIIALQLLTRACDPPGNGHSAVSEAMSTLRLRFGEPVRFRFLVGMLISAGGQGELLAAGMKFINTFLDTSGGPQKRLYIQAELEQAGLDIVAIKKIVPINSPSAEMVFEQLDHWERKHIDVELLAERVQNAEKQNDYLRDKLLLLERRIQILQEEKGVLMSLEQCLKERCSELQDEVTSLKSEKCHKSRTIFHKKDDSTPAEDEGISSSERSLSPEDQNERGFEVYETTDNLDSKLLASEEETTIDDVIQELKNIIDAESAVKDQPKDERKETVSSRIQMRVDVLMDDPIFDSENEIIPSNLHPQPPRRTRSLIHLYIPSEDYDYVNKEIFFENDTPYTSEEGSDSLLSASKCRLPRIEKEKSLTTILDIDNSKKSEEVKKSESFHHNQHRGEDEKAQKDLDKMKSKSLDRIEDGLDAMVDIVLTNQKGLIPRIQSDSGNHTGTTLSRSTSNIFLNARKDFRISKMPSSGRYEDKHKIFLPNHREEVHFPRLQEKGSFLVRRGQLNAGLYSGFQIVQNKRIEISSVQVKHSGSVSKVTDLPSGLY